MTFLALLRAINVGPGRGVPMAELRDLCAGLGWQKVRTYIQSGNVVFEADGNPGDLARILEVALAERYLFPIPAVVRTGAQWRVLAEDRPFEGWSDPKQLSVSVLDRVPDPDRWVSLDPWTDGSDRIELIGDRVWVKTPDGYGKSRFTNAWLEKKLGVKATTRNRATVDALLTLLG